MGTHVDSQHMPKNFIGVSGSPRLSGKFWDTIVGRCGIGNLPGRQTIYDSIERGRRAIENSLPLPPDARNDGELARTILINDWVVGAIRLADDEKGKVRFPDSSYFVG